MPGAIVRPDDGPPRRRVVLTFPLGAAAVEQLRAVVGGDVDLVGVRESDGTEDLVVVTSVSPQLLGRLRRAFPRAGLLAVEVEDQALGVNFAGSVTRALDAGAHGYLVARSIDELGRAIRQATAKGVTTVGPQALSEPATDDLSEVLDVIIRNRARTVT